MRQLYNFSIVLVGTGDSLEEAWVDAVEEFILDPGEEPMTYSTEDLDDEEEEAE